MTTRRPTFCLPWLLLALGAAVDAAAAVHPPRWLSSEGEMVVMRDSRAQQQQPQPRRGVPLRELKGKGGGSSKSSKSYKGKGGSKSSKSYKGKGGSKSSKSYKGKGGSSSSSSSISESKPKHYPKISVTDASESHPSIISFSKGSSSSSSRSSSSSSTGKGGSSSSSSGKGRSYPRDMGSSSIFSGKGKGGGESYCTVKGTTDDPTYPWCPDHFGDDYFACQDIAHGHGPTDADVETYRIDFALEIDGDVVDTLERIEDYLQTYVAPALAGCDDMGTSKTHSNIENVLFEVQEDHDSAPYCDDCTNADVFADVYYTSDSDGIGQQLYDEFVDACDDIKEIEGVADTFDPCPTISVTAVVMTDSDDDGDDDGGGVVVDSDDDDDDNGDDEAEDDDGDRGVVAPPILDEETSKAAEEDDKIAGGAIFGMIIAALVILALLALLLRRRRNKNDEEMLKNLSNEEEVGDRTAMLDDNSRDVDSRFGMYPEGRMEGMVLGERALNQDVHKCSSATCELCDRQNGLQFLPTRARSSRARMDLAGSNKKYGSEDAVSL